MTLDRNPAKTAWKDTAIALNEALGDVMTKITKPRILGPLPREEMNLWIRAQELRNRIEELQEADEE